MTRPVLFLDFDDVICLNATYGGYDAIHAISRIQNEPGLPVDHFEALWHQLFDGSATAHLKAIHEEFMPWYVLSTNWCWLLDRDGLVEVLNRCGLKFIADNLHSDWGTPKGKRPDIRLLEISNWNSANLGFDEQWVVLDDELSGTGLADWPVKPHQPFIVLCKENAGLRGAEYQKLRQAFQLRTKSGPPRQPAIERQGAL